MASLQQQRQQNGCVKFTIKKTFQTCLKIIENEMKSVNKRLKKQTLLAIREMFN